MRCRSARRSVHNSPVAGLAGVAQIGHAVITGPEGLCSAQHGGYEIYVLAAGSAEIDELGKKRSIASGDAFVIPPRTNVVRISGEVMMSQAVMFRLVLLLHCDPVLCRFVDKCT